jgi:hypothetical protein
MTTNEKQAWAIVIGIYAAIGALFVLFVLAVYFAGQLAFALSPVLGFMFALACLSWWLRGILG